MLKALLNECSLKLEINSCSPFIIKDGRFDKINWLDKGRLNAGNEKEYPNNIFICENSKDEIEKAINNKNYASLKFYIPGSSLRGVMRSHLEKIVRILSKNKNELLCCDPFDEDRTLTSPKVSCSTRLEQNPVPVSYSNICLICKLFGCTGLKSRIIINDSSNPKDINTNIRNGIAIDRFTGGVYNKANFNNFLLENVAFESIITIRNFELWQLGLLAYLFRDFEEEQICIGFGKSKGFGKIKGKVKDVKLIYYGKETNNLIGIEDCITQEDAQKYNIIQSPREPFILGSADSQDYIYTYKILDSNKITDNDFWKYCAGIWNYCIVDNHFMNINELKEKQNQIQQKVKAE